MFGLTFARYLEQRERGDALVLVIASVFLVGVMVTSLVTITLNATGRSAATRAHSQALAAAEGGIEVTARMLISSSSSRPACAAQMVSTESSAIDYTITVEYIPENGTEYRPCDGTPIPDLAEAVKFTSTGTAQQLGTNRNRSRNTATVERVFERSKPNKFTEAVFGDQGITTSTNLVVEPDDQHPSGTQYSPDLVTNGEWYCPSTSTIGGSIYALGGGTTNSTCEIKGDLYVNGDFKVPSRLTVGGKMYVNGNLTTNSGNLHVAGDLLVRGNYEMNQADTIGGDIRASGWFYTTDSTALRSTTGTLYLGLGKKNETSWNLNQVFTTYASKIVTNANMSSDAWKLPTIMEESTRTPEEIAKLKFPFIFKDDPMFDGFSPMSYSEFVAATGMMSSKTCTAYNFTKTLVIEKPTFIDLTECNFTKSAGNLNIVLKADAVIYTNGFTNSSGALNITNGMPADSTKRFTLYMMAQPTSGQNTCVDLPTDQPRFNLPSGSWSQVDATGKVRTKVLMYSAGETKVNGISLDSFYGQIYGCTVNVPTTKKFRYARVGDDVQNNLLDLNTILIRDITQ